MTCQFCGKVLEPFKNESDEDIFGIPAGDWEDMMEPDCNNCQGLRGRLNAAYSTLSNIDPTCKPSFSFTLEGRKLSVEFRLENSLGSYGLEVCLELMTEASYPWGQGKVMNPDWIDSYLFLKWKSSCDEQHGTCEVSLVLKLSSFPAAELGWFVDVNNFCIVCAPTYPKAKYVALSYVWGCVRILHCSPILMSFRLSMLFCPRNIWCAYRLLFNTQFVSHYLSESDSSGWTPCALSKTTTQPRGDTSTKWFLSTPMK